MLEIMKASAGSGKTYRLARKYITLLLKSNDRYAYRHILAVTFTNKATEEMKSRILKELHVLATKPLLSGYHDHFVPSIFPTDDDVSRKAKAVLSDMLHDYSAFAVSTIDRFFQQTLKAFSREIGQFASYQIELDKNSLVAESVDRVLDSLTEKDSGLLSWLTDNVLEQIEQGGRYSLDANLLDMAKRLKSPQRQEVLENSGLDPDEIYPKEKLLKIKDICRKIESDFRSLLHQKAHAALDILEAAGVNPSESNRGFLKALYAYAELEEGDRISPPSASFMNKARDHEQWFAKTKASKLKPLVYPFLEAPLEEFCDLFDKEFKVYNTALVLDGQLYGLGVAEELDKAFKELMKEKNVLCLDDSNTILRDIIDGSDAPFVYEKLGVRYDHFLLDEFQDTSNVQWSNFSPLLRESESKDGDSLIVGDVKQSIYRWRGSDWKLLNQTVPDSFPRHSQEVLDTNFRSKENIVAFNNCFFKSASGLLDRMNGQEEYGSISDIYADVAQKAGRTSDEKGSVRLTFCEKEKELEKVYDAVLDAVASGASYSDIAVLVRSNAIGEDVAMHLINNDVPVITDDSLRVKSSITVRRLVSLMAYADNPHDTVNGYLANCMDIRLADKCSSLTDMVEAIYRMLKEGDDEGLWKGESVHVQSFMDHVQDYVTTNGNSLRGFLKHWEEVDPSVSSPSSGDSIRVMTIHKSKGLDFPYVIIPFVESVTLFKSGSHWCVPDLRSTPLQDIAEGVYDVSLSRSSEDTLFADDYRKEAFLQQVDNINIIYVAMTRAALGMHLIACKPSSKCMKALDSGDLSQFSDFSQMLYWFASASCTGDVPGNEDLLPPFEVSGSLSEDGTECFDIGTLPDFRNYRKLDRDGIDTFAVRPGLELPSIPLNFQVEDESCDVRERGRLKFSADSLDFFSEDGDAGISASNRIRGVVLHEVLSRVKKASDLDDALRDSVLKGDITQTEAASVYLLLSERLKSASERGWFSEEAERTLNEATLIDTDGQAYRPDRVEISGGRVSVIDFKFGEHYRKYEHQLKRYADMWHRMGYPDVNAYLWYVLEDKVIEVL